jgi:hypothetical protein
VASGRRKLRTFEAVDLGNNGSTPNREVNGTSFASNVHAIRRYPLVVCNNGQGGRQRPTVGVMFICRAAIASAAGAPLDLHVGSYGSLPVGSAK